MSWVSTDTDEHDRQDVGSTYAKLVLHHRLNEPEAREEDVRLGGGGLGQLEQQPSSLRQALRREEDDVQ
jgi:hypothetical protein